VSFTVTIPKDHFDYLELLALRKHRLGSSAKKAAELMLIRELDALFKSDYHKKQFSES
jgi:hypothetical protein